MGPFSATIVEIVRRMGATSVLHEICRMLSRPLQPLQHWSLSAPRFWCSLLLLHLSRSTFVLTLGGS